jgi:hypothetical protein
MPQSNAENFKLRHYPLKGSGSVSGYGVYQDLAITS